jgi:hypothetical protein
MPFVTGFVQESDGSSQSSRSPDTEQDPLTSCTGDCRGTEEKGNGHRARDAKQNVSHYPKTFSTDDLACSPTAQSRQKQPKQIRHSVHRRVAGISSTSQTFDMAILRRRWEKSLWAVVVAVTVRPVFWHLKRKQKGQLEVHPASHSYYRWSQYSACNPPRLSSMLSLGRHLDPESVRMLSASLVAIRSSWLPTPRWNWRLQARRSLLAKGH